MTDKEKLDELLAKRERLLLKGSDDEKMNDKMRNCRK